jgi:hypothetical protein
MFDALDHGVIFIEQVINFKWHKHAVIECIPVPADAHADAPAFFKVIPSLSSFGISLLFIKLENRRQSMRRTKNGRSTRN